MVVGTDIEKGFLMFCGCRYESRPKESWINGFNEIIWNFIFLFSQKNMWVSIQIQHTKNCLILNVIQNHPVKFGSYFFKILHWLSFSCRIPSRYMLQYFPVASSSEYPRVRVRAEQTSLRYVTLTERLNLSWSFRSRRAPAGGAALASTHKQPLLFTWRCEFTNLARELLVAEALSTYA